MADLEDDGVVARRDDEGATGNGQTELGPVTPRVQASETTFADASCCAELEHQIG
jgi:hypothetical protein